MLYRFVPYSLCVWWAIVSGFCVSTHSHDDKITYQHVSQNVCPLLSGAYLYSVTKNNMSMVYKIPCDVSCCICLLKIRPFNSCYKVVSEEKLSLLILTTVIAINLTTCYSKPNPPTRGIRLVCTGLPHKILPSLILHPRTYEDGTDTVFRNVSY
jgi:hypothetical protein